MRKSALHPFYFVGVGLIILLVVGGLVGSTYLSLVDEKAAITQERDALSKRVQISMANLSQVTSSYSALLSDDQYVRNNKLQDQMKAIHDRYVAAITSYESLLSLRDQSPKTYPMLEGEFAEVLSDLADQKYDAAGTALEKLNANIKKTKDDLAAEAAAAAAKAAAELAAKAAADAAKAAAQAKAQQASIPQSNTAPESGYVRQTVNADGQNYVVDIVAGNLNSTKVIVDTASTGDCGDNCPVLSLADYVNRNSAYAGINGGYFCPASYPSCAGKTNSFDTLLMNKNKTYFNSANNVYSVVPAIIFQGGSIKVVERSLEWGRDTGIDSMIANQGLLLMNGNIKFTGDGDPKKEAKGIRGFVGNKGNIAYIGMVQNATVAESAKVMKAMGLDNALNLDSGGSSALWVNGLYRFGPGRNIPNAILFLHK